MKNKLAVEQYLFGQRYVTHWYGIACRPVTAVREAFIQSQVI